MSTSLDNRQRPKRRRRDRGRAHHRHIMHGRGGKAEYSRRRQRRAGAAGRQPERQRAAGERNRHTRRAKARIAGGMVKRRHPDVMHDDKGGGQQPGGDGQPRRRERPCAQRIDRTARHQHPDQKRQQRRQHQIAGRRPMRGQQRREVHDPDRRRQGKSGPGEQQAPARAGSRADLHGQMQADRAARDCEQDRQQDEPGCVAHRHAAIP